MNKIVLLIILLCCNTAMAQTPVMEISTKNNSENENKVVAIMRELLTEYNLSKWIFTTEMIVEQRVIPHSHPILTLNTASMNKVDILDTFIHEQLHWYVDKYPEAEKKAITEFKKKYKNVPYQNRAGARDEYSTYLHLIVCYLEYRSMARLIGEEEAKQLMWNQAHYTWIYNKIIEDSQYIGSILEKNGFNVFHE